MSKREIPKNIQLILMGKSGGKCEFRGCEDLVIEEVLTKRRGNYSNFGHIIADSPNGPRGDKELSDKLYKEESNIIVLCRKHHKLIDIDDYKEIYTVEELRKMKKEHEEYIEELMKVNKQSFVVAIKYSASISNRPIAINDDEIRRSIFKQQKYCTGSIIDLSNSKYDEMKNNSFYTLEKSNIGQNFFQVVKPLLKKEIVPKIFLYAIAPQSLLIYLGTLFSDITDVEVQQLQREPEKEWFLSLKEEKKFKVKTLIPEKKNKKVALNISITGDITEERIKSALGEECDIVKIESNMHGNDIIKEKKQLEIYRKEIRYSFEKIKDIYGRNCEISIFPAMPISLAIETGRCWMKKIHPKLAIYDEKSGFKKVLEIEYEGEN